MDQHGIEGVAHAGALHFGVLHDINGPLQVGALVDEDVADADAAGDDRDGALLPAQAV